jgi:hypothetical protein
MRQDSAIMDDAATRLAALGAELRHAARAGDSPAVLRLDDERRALLAAVEDRPTPALRRTLAEEIAADLEAMAALRAAMGEMSRARKARRTYDQSRSA